LEVLRVSLRELMEEDTSLFFDTEDGFGEAATYNDVAVTVIPEIGKELQAGNVITNELRNGFSDRAVFGVLISDVAVPVANDKIVHNGKSWTVTRLLSTESGMHRVECGSQYRPHGLRR
jgi:hypothetical protein